MKSLFLTSLALTCLCSCSPNDCMPAGWKLVSVDDRMCAKLLGAGSCGSPSQDQSYQACVPVDEPPLEGQALTPSADACAAPYAGNEPCAACVHSSCCAEVLSCFQDDVCGCNLAKQIAGSSWPAEATCDVPGNDFHDASACLAAHCEAECLP